MPNHVINELVFRGVNAEQQDAIIAATCDAEGKVDFEILLPPPLNIWMGSSGSAHDKAFRRTWYDWSIENWGTKWNAYSHKPTDRTSDGLILRFETAWAPPYPWLAAVMNKLELSFDHNWLDEGAVRGRSGKFSMEGPFGRDWSEVEATDEMHRHLHKLHWGVEEFTDDDA